MQWYWISQCCAIEQWPLIIPIPFDAFLYQYNPIYTISMPLRDGNGTDQNVIKNGRNAKFPLILGHYHSLEFLYRHNAIHFGIHVAFTSMPSYSHLILYFSKQDLFFKVSTNHSFTSFPPYAVSPIEMQKNKLKNVMKV